MSVKTKTPAAKKRPAKKKTAPPRRRVAAKPVPAKPTLEAVIRDALADMKAQSVTELDVRGVTDIADRMVIASGTSDRHVRSIAERVVERAKEAGFRPHGIEGLSDGEWVLIDLSDTIVHLMLPRVREFYGLEKLWDLKSTRRPGGHG